MADSSGGWIGHFISTWYVACHLYLRIFSNLGFVLAIKHPSWGPLFHDLKFKGERILYEMALMETYAAYSGNSGHGEYSEGVSRHRSLRIFNQGEIMFLDAHYNGLGNRAYTLQKGVDCPETAVYLPGPNGFDPFNPSIRADSQVGHAVFTSFATHRSFFSVYL